MNNKIIVVNNKSVVYRISHIMGKFYGNMFFFDNRLKQPFRDLLKEDLMLDFSCYKDFTYEEMKEMINKREKDLINKGEVYIIYPDFKNQNDKYVFLNSHGRIDKDKLRNFFDTLPFRYVFVNTRKDAIKLRDRLNNKMEAL